MTWLYSNNNLNRFIKKVKATKKRHRILLRKVAICTALGFISIVTMTLISIIGDISKPGKTFLTKTIIVYILPYQISCLQQLFMKRDWLVVKEWICGMEIVINFILNKKKSYCLTLSQVSLSKEVTFMTPMHMFITLMPDTLTMC